MYLQLQYQIEKRKEKIKKLYDNNKVMDAAEYCVDCIGVVGTMEEVQYLLLGIAGALEGMLKVSGNQVESDGAMLVVGCLALGGLVGEL